MHCESVDLTSKQSGNVRKNIVQFVEKCLMKNIKMSRLLDYTGKMVSISYYFNGFPTTYVMLFCV